nr:hypothetical protein [Tanacetum cinerariifolium]
MSDMTSCLNGLRYIPLNNEQNEPTQRDIGEISNEPTQVIHNQFEELYASANKELKGYKLSPSYYAIKKTFKTIGLGYESIHACVNDCFLFRDEDNKDKQICPVCNTSRWKDNNTTGKKVPKKVLHYFSIISRLQGLYKSSHTAKEMTWHATKKCTEPDKMQHMVDGRAWKKFDTPQSYSIWPVILTTYNMPSWLCTKECYLMWTLLIPGPKSSSKDIDVYLRPLINDLKDLWALKGVETIDVATGQKFNMRAMVLQTINDFHARSSLSGWSEQGYMACPTCNEDTPSMREEMLRLKDLDSNMPTSVPYIGDEIMAMVRQGKQWGHIPGVEKENKELRKEINMLMKVVRSDDMITQLQSQHDVGSGSGSDGGGDYELGEDVDADEDEDADGDKDS